MIIFLNARVAVLEPNLVQQNSHKRFITLGRVKSLSERWVLLLLQHYWWIIPLLCELPPQCLVQLLRIWAQMLLHLWILCPGFLTAVSLNTYLSQKKPQKVENVKLYIFHSKNIPYFTSQFQKFLTDVLWPAVTTCSTVNISLHNPHAGKEWKVMKSGCSNSNHISVNNMGMYQNIWEYSYLRSILRWLSWRLYEEIVWRTGPIQCISLSRSGLGSSVCCFVRL